MFSAGLRRGAQLVAASGIRAVPVLRQQKAAQLACPAVALAGVRGVKTSTGLVGLPVDPNGRETLTQMAQQVLDSVQKIPAHTEYRKAIDKWFTFIKKTCEKHTQIEAIEEEIDLGQIEEVIEMCKNELDVIDMYHENKVWEIVEREKEYIQQHIHDIKDSLFYTDPAAQDTNATPPPPGQPPK